MNSSNSNSHLRWNKVTWFIFLTQLAINTTVNKIDIYQVEYHYLCDRVTIVWLLWRHHQLIVTPTARWKLSGETWGLCVKIIILSSFMDSLCHVRNKIMYVLSWWTVSALTRVLIWCLFPSLLHNLGNKHQKTLSWASGQPAWRPKSRLQWMGKMNTIEDGQFDIEFQNSRFTTF